MANVGHTYVTVQGDWSRFNRDLSSQGRGIARKFASVGRIGGAALGAGLAAGAVGVKKVIEDATDLGEEVSKTNVVFRDSGKEIVAWSKGTSGALGISRQAALEATGVFGNMLVPMGLARGEAGKMSTRMVTLAGDMASFNNASPEDTLDALRAGLAGETEPLRRFGVFLNQARIEQEAMRLGLKEGNEELNASAKAQATYAIILKDTGDAQGDFARTSDSLANKQRILRARIDNISAGLGKTLLPAAQDAAGGFDDVLASIERVVTRGDIDLGEKLGLVKADLAPVVKRIGEQLAGLELDEKLAGVVSDAIPIIANQAAEGAPKVAAAFAQGFVDADVWGRLIVGGVLLKKMGGVAAFTALGRKGGVAMGAGLLAGAGAGAGGGAVAAGAAGAAGGGVLSRVKGAVGRFPVGAAAVAAVTFGPDLLKGERDPRAKEDALQIAEATKKRTDSLTEYRDELLKTARARQAAVHGDKDYQRSVRASGDALEKLAGHVDTAINRTEALKRLNDQGVGVRIDSAVTERGAERVMTAFDQMRARAGGDIDDIKKQTRYGTREIRRALTDDPKAGKEALAQNFALAAEAVRKSMDGAAGETKEGLALVNQYMRAALAKYGITGRAADHYLNRRDSNGTPLIREAQQGAYITGGKPTGDSIPALLERGEYVMNREAVKHVGRSVLDRVNFSDAPRFQTGGIVSVPGFPGEMASSSILDEIARTRARSGLILTDAYGAGHESPGHTTTGTAADWSGPDAAMDREVQQLVREGYLVGYDGRFGSQDWPNHGPSTRTPNYHLHVEYGAGGGKAGAALAEAVKRIALKEVDWEGPGGTIGAIGQRTLDIARSAAQDVADRARRETAAVVPDSGGGPGRASAGGQFDKAALARLWVRAGGPPDVANTMAAIALAESGGNPRAQGPLTSYGFRAAGLWQIHPPQGNDFDPLTNARYAVGKYRGGGLQPWEAYTNGAYQQYMQRGGLVEMLQAGGTAGSSVGRSLTVDPGTIVGNAFGGRDGKRRARLEKLLANARGNDIAPLIARIKELGLPNGLAKRLASTKRGMALAAEGAFSASALDAEPPDLDYENMTLAELQSHARGRGIDPTGLNAPTLASRLRETIPGAYRGKDQIQWLTELLGQQFSRRNVLIRSRGAALEKNTQVEKLLGTAGTRLQEVLEGVFSAKGQQRQLEQQENVLKRELGKAEEKPKKNADLIKRLKGRLSTVRDRLKATRGTLKTREGLRDDLKKRVIPALDRRSDNLEDFAGAGVREQLDTLQGIGRPKNIMKTLPDLSVLGGEIGDTRLSLRDLTRAKPIIADDTEDASADSSSEPDSRIADLLREQIRELKLRAKVSDAAFEVFRDMPPYGGKFHSGGVVPGRPGEEKLAILKARETVLPVGTPVIARATETVSEQASGQQPPVIIVIQDGAVDAGKIKQIVNGEFGNPTFERSVAGATRRTARTAARGLPGAGGGMGR